MDKTIAVGFVALIVFTALAHGVVEPWSELIFVLWVMTLVLLWVIEAVREKQLRLCLPPTIWPLAAFLALGLAQSFAFKDRDGYRRGLSLDVEATRGTTLLLGCLLLCSLLAANFLARREQLRKLAQFLTIFGLLLAGFALIQHFTWNERFYWLRAAQTEAPFGPFVNRNHFAGYMELLMPWPVALLLFSRRREEKIFYGFAAAWMAAAAIFSLSRGGMISIFAELMFLAAFSPRDASGDMPGAVASRSRAALLAVRGGAILAILAATLGGLVWLGAERVVDRLAAGQEAAQGRAAAQGFAASRGELWRDSWAVFRAHPLTGAGLGAFATAFPSYNQGWNVGLVTAQTHNDYLQVLTDGGLAGALIALWFLAAAARAIRRGLRAREPFMRPVVLACGAGIFGLLVHSLFDFNLQLPAHALLFLSFAAIAAQSSELAAVAPSRVPRPVVTPEPITLAQRNQEV